LKTTNEMYLQHLIVMVKTRNVILTSREGKRQCKEIQTI